MDSTLQTLSDAVAGISETTWMFRISFAFIFIWLVVLIIFYIILIRKYTFGNWTQDNPNPYATETMGIPRGILRGTLTLSVLFIVMIFEVINLHVGGLESDYEMLMTAFQMVLAFYFGSKVMDHVTKADEEKSIAASEAMIEMKKVQTESPETFEVPGSVG